MGELAMPSHDIFYSWQSDLPNSTNRGFIEDCLNRAIKEVRADEELKLDPCLERDTRGVPGSPDIAATIFDKIKRADIFVGDVSFINQEASRRKTPNPNVLVELGYAAGCLGWDRIICVFNEATGGINDLPFDIRQRRVRAYGLVEGQEKAEPRKALVGVLKADITDILHAPDKGEAEALQQLLSTLATELISVIILGTEFEQRSINPWLDSLRFQFQSTADMLRHLATTDTATKHSMNVEQEELAQVLDEAGNISLDTGTWPHFAALVQQAVEKATAMKQARIDGVPLSDESLTEVRATLTTTQRKLAGLAARAEDMANQGRIDDLQSEPSQLGNALLRVGYCNIDAIQSGLAQRVREIGQDLHLIEMMPVYCDGGRSVQAIVDRIRKNAGDLTELVDSLDREP
jgi:hypothetical protein